MTGTFLYRLAVPYTRLAACMAAAPALADARDAHNYNIEGPSSIPGWELQV